MRLVVDRLRSYGATISDDGGELVSPDLYDVQIEEDDFEVDFVEVTDDGYTVIHVPQTERELKLDNGMYINVKFGSFYDDVQIIEIGDGDHYLLEKDFSSYVSDDKLTVKLDQSIFTMLSGFEDGVYYTDAREMFIVSSSFSELRIKPSQVYAEHNPVRSGSFPYQVQEWIDKAYEEIMNAIPKRFQSSIINSYEILELTDVVNMIIYLAIEKWEQTRDDPRYTYKGMAKKEINKYRPKFRVDSTDKAVKRRGWSHW